jgi:hypothetical protein
MCIAINEMNGLENVPVLELKPDIMVVVCTGCYMRRINSAQRYIFHLYISSREPLPYTTPSQENIHIPFPPLLYILEIKLA